MKTTSSNIAQTSQLGVWATVRRGVATTPELVDGLWWTLLLALAAAGGKVAVPIAIQQAVDATTESTAVVSQLTGILTIAVIAIIVAAGATMIVNMKLVSNAERALARLRREAFDHIHQLSILTQNTERRGALVSRVTSDVDTISMFVQWGGLMLLTSLLQIAAATTVMLVYSWQLTLLVWITFIPFMLILRPAQQRVNRSFTAVRQRMGELLGTVSETVVGSATIYSNGVGATFRDRLMDRIEAHRQSGVQAMTRVALAFSAGVFAANIVLVVVIVAGAYLGVAGNISSGQLVAFLFLTQLFTGPVQLATEVLNELQNAVAGWRRVLAVLDTDADVTSPVSTRGQRSYQGGATLALHSVGYHYPGGPQVLHDVSLTIPAGTRYAVVGETGSGKTTLAKLITRFSDPTHGHITFDGIDLRDYSNEDLRAAILLIPQEGFLFHATLAQNIGYGLTVRYPTITPAEQEAHIARAVSELGLQTWVDTLPQGLNTSVGQRGERLSAGERQLVALARAYLSRAELIVMDEVTSAVDPATEVMIARALEKLMQEKTTITIAHRLSTAAVSDAIIVMDHGKVVEQGTHTELFQAGGRYTDMYNAWISQTTTATARPTSPRTSS